MKTIIRLFIAAAILAAFSGCVSSAGKDYAKFISQVPGIEATGVSAVTRSPLYSHSESASGISTDPNTGALTVVDGTGEIAIPLWGFSKTIKITGLKMQASPAQLEAAKAILNNAAKAASDASQPQTK